MNCFYMDPDKGNPDLNPWWSVDLGSNHQILSLKITNRDNPASMLCDTEQSYVAKDTCVCTIYKHNNCVQCFAKYTVM